MPSPDEKKITNRMLATLKEGRPVRIDFPEGGMLHIDKPVPFLVVFRYPPDQGDQFTPYLGKTESSYLIANDKSPLLRPILQTLTSYLSDKFSAFMILEVWIDPKSDDDFTIVIHPKVGDSIADFLRAELNGMAVGHYVLSTAIQKSEQVCPPFFKPLMTSDTVKKSETMLIGLAIKPMYLNSKSGKSYPLFIRELRSVFSSALKKTFYEFIRLHTSFNAAHFQILGKTVIDDSVWAIDRKLASCSQQFDFLLLLSPVNYNEAWASFSKSRHQKMPVFHYRHMPVDPEFIKREIYNLPIENIDDPTVAFLFRDKRKEIDRMLNMLAEREKPDFVQSSIQVFGKIEEQLLEVGKALLVSIPRRSDDEEKDFVDAVEFKALAEDEINWLHQQYDGLMTEVQIREDTEGIMVSSGKLIIGQNFKVERQRADALLQHEVGTHIVTYFNGLAQPFHLLRCGVPGYEQLQEGLAVLAEYIMGGLTGSRMRMLGARVVAVYQMIAGHNFIDTFHMLVDHYGFSPERAFSITTRVYRGGGLTKDGGYLKGLLYLLTYLKEGNEIEPLLIGKIRQDYIPIIEELIYRRLLRPIPIKPRYLGSLYNKKLTALKKGVTVFNMIQQ